MLFNTENELDLGDEFRGLGGSSSKYSDYEWPGAGCWCPSYKHEYSDDESLISSKVFQHQLSMALSHKDKEIGLLRQEILDLHQKLSEMENIPTSEWEEFAETLGVGEVRVGLEPLKGRVV